MRQTRRNTTRRPRLTPEQREAAQRAALARAQAPHPVGNTARVIAECLARGYADPVPGENVLTFHAWRAVGRRSGRRGRRLHRALSLRLHAVSGCRPARDRQGVTMRLTAHETPEHRRREAARWRRMAREATAELRRLDGVLANLTEGATRNYWLGYGAHLRALAREREQSAEREESRAAAVQAALDRGEATR